MHEDMGRPFAIGLVVSWDVLLVDAGAEGWPDDVLIDTHVVIEERPTFARGGSLARTPQLSACRSGEQPVGSHLRIRAGLRADLFNLPFLSTVTGVVQRIQIVTRRMSADRRGVWIPSGEWRLADMRESPRWLAPTGRDPSAAQEVGFLVGPGRPVSRDPAVSRAAEGHDHASVAGCAPAVAMIETGPLGGCAIKS